MSFNGFVKKNEKLSSSFFFAEDDSCDTNNYMSSYTWVYLQL